MNRTHARSSYTKLKLFLCAYLRLLRDTHQGISTCIELTNNLLVDNASDLQKLKGAQFLLHLKAELNVKTPKHQLHLRICKSSTML